MHPLTALREAAHMTRAKLGQLAGCTGQTIGRIEAGKHRPSLYLAARIAEALNQPIDVVFPELAEKAEFVSRVWQTSKQASRST
ncbi:MAG: helix-turn-helix domain-containing protein [Limnochordales bacterium]